MKIAVCPGSFDPVTLGHIDIFRRTCALFDRVIVLVLQNYKKTPLFSLDKRREIINNSIIGLSNIEVACYEGLCADYCRKLGNAVIVKGLRNASDLAYEQEIAEVNMQLAGIETLFLPCRPEFERVSTSTALHLFDMGADVSAYLPTAAIRALREIKL